ncbi:hypothetical protein A3K63_02065 [Candidatus Micrarchaeota archaeon RBG_16_49_10]|nr:MAG: hypothetical protein A3K63_02065 [Candidatus Micrarchaeota archaeon RBG_16_49_10]
MQKKDVSTALTSFYQFLLDQRKGLYPNDFIVIGGASLVLQDAIQETADIDLLTRRRNLGRLCEILYESGNHHRYVMKSKLPGTLPITVMFSYSDANFDVFPVEKSLGNLAENSMERIWVSFGGYNGFVRPIESVMGDYRLAIDALERRQDLIHVTSEKITKYRERLSQLERRYS